MRVRPLTTVIKPPRPAAGNSKEKANESIRTEPVGIVPHCVHLLVPADSGFIAKGVVDQDNITLHHYFHGIATTLMITLYPNGTWVAQKHVEVCK